MKTVYFHVGVDDVKVIYRVKKLLSNEDFKQVKPSNGETVFEVKVKGSEDLQRVRELSKNMPPRVSLRESKQVSATQMLIESNNPLEAIRILSERGPDLGWSLNLLALELMAGREGTLVIDGYEVWIFSDSREDLRRVMLDVMYDSRFNVPFTKEFDIKSKYKNSPEAGGYNKRESHSQKVSLGKILTDADIEYYRGFPSTKNFFFRDEYKHWF